MSELTDQIILHIFNNLGITSHTTLSLNSDSFLLSKTIAFQNLEGNSQQAPLWGAEISIDKIKLRLLLADFSEGDKELILIVKLDNAPSYGIYISHNSSDFFEEIIPNEAFILFSLKENEWLITNTYIQATFLAGMEQLQDISASWSRINKFDDMISNVKSLIEYHNNSSEYYEDQDEG